MYAFQVEFATDLCDGSKPRAWSKYSKDSSAFEKKHGAKTESSNEKEKQKTEIKKKKKDERIEALLGDVCYILSFCLIKLLYLLQSF